MVYVDSPMATTATEVFKRNAQVFDDEMKEYITKGDNPLDFKNLKFTRTQRRIHASLTRIQKPKVIISTSGMCEAGRIRHHLKHNLWNSKAKAHNFRRISGGGNFGKIPYRRCERSYSFWRKNKSQCAYTQSGGFFGTCG